MSCVTCPQCNGEGPSIGIACGSKGCRVAAFPCSLCEGTGTITAERLEWFERGGRMREARKRAGRILRDEARLRGLSQVDLSKMEAGRIEPCDCHSCGQWSAGGCLIREYVPDLTGCEDWETAKARPVHAWNLRFGIGTPVVVKRDDGSELDTVTRSEAWLVGGHTPVVLVEGITGGYALDRVRPKGGEA